MCVTHINRIKKVNSPLELPSRVGASPLLGGQDSDVEGIRVSSREESGASPALSRPNSLSRAHSMVTRSMRPSYPEAQVSHFLEATSPAVSYNTQSTRSTQDPNAFSTGIDLFNAIPDSVTNSDDLL